MSMYSSDLSFAAWHSIISNMLHSLIDCKNKFIEKIHKRFLSIYICTSMYKHEA